MRVLGKEESAKVRGEIDGSLTDSEGEVRLYQDKNCAKRCEDSSRPKPASVSADTWTPTSRRASCRLRRLRLPRPACVSCYSSRLWRSGGCRPEAGDVEAEFLSGKVAKRGLYFTSRFARCPGGVSLIEAGEGSCSWSSATPRRCSSWSSIHWIHAFCSGIASQFLAEVLSPTSRTFWYGGCYGRHERRRPPEIVCHFPRLEERDLFERGSYSGLSDLSR